MKWMIAIFALFSIFELSVKDTYLTKQQQFKQNVEKAYDKYLSQEYTTEAGELIVVMGIVEEQLSFSVYFMNERSSFYQVKIIEKNKKEKGYILSNYEDYQIFYHMIPKSNSEYSIQLIGQNKKDPYCEFSICQTATVEEFLQKDYKLGEGTHIFPYQTKLKNHLTSRQTIALAGCCIIGMEGIAIAVIFGIKRKKRLKKIETSPKVIYNNIEYKVEDDETHENDGSNETI